MAVLTLGTLRALSRPLVELGLLHITHILADLSSFRRSTTKSSSQTLEVSLPAVLLLRTLPLPTSRGGKTSRQSVQNGGTVRNGLKEIRLMSIKNGRLITMANGTIGNLRHFRRSSLFIFLPPNLDTLYIYNLVKYCKYNSISLGWESQV